MECWFIKGFFLFMIHIHFHVKMNFTNNPLPHSPSFNIVQDKITQYSSIPTFPPGRRPSCNGSA